jgi:hypothetical protein
VFDVLLLSMKNNPFAVFWFYFLIMKIYSFNFFVFLADTDDSLSRHRSTDVSEGRITPSRTGKIIILKSIRFPIIRSAVCLISEKKNGDVCQ